MSEHILYEIHDSVARLTLNRPEKLNAITRDMASRLDAICRELDKDDTVAVVLLSGAGERAFCAGSDLHSLGEYQTMWHYRDRVEYAAAIRNIKKPVIVALQGWVLGGGLEIALGADIRIAGKGARFGAPEVARGWVGGGGASQLLPRLVGYGQAMRLLLTGEPIEALEAERLGLIDILVEDDAVLERALALCHTLTQHNPRVLQTVKASVRAALSVPLEAGLHYENELTSLCFAAGNYPPAIARFSSRKQNM